MNTKIKWPVEMEDCKRHNIVPFDGISDICSDCGMRISFGVRTESSFEPIFSNSLSPAEEERLAILLEELGETQQIIGKILRHGYESYSPNDHHQITNRTLLERELGDVVFAVEFLSKNKDISGKNVRENALDKAKRIKYLHHNKIN